MTRAMTASTETPDEPKAAARISDVPTDRLAHNFVGTLIEAEGLINLWDAMAVKLITMLREEFAEDIAAAVAAEREATAKICDEYADRMDRSAKAREDAGTPSYTAECKADAGQSLAAAIRSRRP